MTRDTPPTHPERISARRAAVRRLSSGAPTDRRADTQRRLLDAGRTVIAENGVGGASVGLITSAAGFSRGAFYSNFQDMDHFVEQLAQREWRIVLAAMDQTLARVIAQGAVGPAPSSEMDALPRFVDALLAVIPRDREFYLLWTSLSDFAVRFPEGSAHLRAAFSQFIQGVAGSLVEALAGLGLEAAVDPRDIVDLAIGVGARAVHARLITDDAHDRDLLERLLPVLIPAVIRPAHR